MPHRLSNLCVSLTLIGMIVLSSVAPATTITYSQGEYTAYLPIILTPPSQIHGSVTYHGQPIAGLPVRLLSCIIYYRFGRHCGVFRTVKTDSEGQYNFANVPSLEPDSSLMQYAYQIAYDSHDLASPLADGLASWWLPGIEEYTAGSNVHAGDFDIGGLAPLTPSNGAILPAPSGPTTTTLLFRWTPRENAPTLGYSVWLRSNYIDMFSGPLGSTDAYSITLGYSPTCEPYRLCPSQVYAWDIRIYDTQTNYGVTQAYTFTLSLP
jgi:hypothetical protein